eukprot:TRINITY_DN7173_c0_g1_i1.p1 TRINITY_DN7173_c0_g1~~TRINITY_DN7173_c0_g1_i1.p1  ORF type:complete len:737 (+),score=141.53 TRINITY_DN7173_c0_g1_i1:91-2301(+)
MEPHAVPPTDGGTAVSVDLALTALRAVEAARGGALGEEGREALSGCEAALGKLLGALGMTEAELKTVGEEERVALQERSAALMEENRHLVALLEEPVDVEEQAAQLAALEEKSLALMEENKRLVELLTDPTPDVAEEDAATNTSMPQLAVSLAPHEATLASPARHVPTADAETSPPLLPAPAHGPEVTDRGVQPDGDDGNIPGPIPVPAADVVLEAHEAALASPARARTIDAETATVLATLQAHETTLVTSPAPCADEGELHGRVPAPTVDAVTSPVLAALEPHEATVVNALVADAAPQAPAVHLETCEGSLAVPAGVATADIGTDPCDAGSAGALLPLLHSMRARVASVQKDLCPPLSPAPDGPPATPATPPTAAPCTAAATASPSPSPPSCAYLPKVKGRKSTTPARPACPLEPLVYSPERAAATAARAAAARHDVAVAMVKLDAARAAWSVETARTRRASPPPPPPRAAKPPPLAVEDVDVRLARPLSCKELLALQRALAAETRRLVDSAARGLSPVRGQGFTISAALPQSPSPPAAPRSYAALHRAAHPPKATGPATRPESEQSAAPRVPRLQGAAKGAVDVRWRGQPSSATSEQQILNRLQQRVTEVYGTTPPRPTQSEDVDRTLSTLPLHVYGRVASVTPPRGAVSRTPLAGTPQSSVSLSPERSDPPTVPPRPDASPRRAEPVALVKGRLTKPTEDEWEVGIRPLGMTLYAWSQVCVAMLVLGCLASLY